MFIRCPYCGSENVRQFFPIGSGYKCLECGRILDASLDWKETVTAVSTGNGSGIATEEIEWMLVELGEALARELRNDIEAARQATDASASGQEAV